MFLLPVFHLPWRTIQITINVVTIVFGFMTFLPLSYVKYYFKDQCVLYAHPRFLKQGPSEGSPDIVLDLRVSEWGAPSTCNFVTFLSVTVGIHAFIWCWYLLLMKNQLKHEQHEHTILFPCFLLHALMCVTVFISSSMIHAGTVQWCSELTKELFITYNQKYTCEETQDLQWDILERKHKIYTFLLVAKVSSWLMMLALLAQTLVSGYKIYTWILKTETTQTSSIPKKSPQKTYESTSGYDVNNDEQTLASEVDWENDDSLFETSKTISSIPKKSPLVTYDSTSGYDVTNDEQTMASEVDWDNDDSMCETTKTISFDV